MVLTTACRGISAPAPGASPAPLFPLTLLPPCCSPSHVLTSSSSLARKKPATTNSKILAGSRSAERLISSRFRIGESPAVFPPPARRPCRHRAGSGGRRGVVGYGQPGRPGSRRAAEMVGMWCIATGCAGIPWQQRLIPSGKTAPCCFAFVLKCVITEVLPTSLIGPAACPCSEPSGIGSAGHGGSFQKLFTEATSVALYCYQKNRPCQINTFMDSWIAILPAVYSGVLFDLVHP
ncbi:coiled-coil domain-containing protein 126 isoform 1-T1 [Cyanocitta cristata]